MTRLWYHPIVVALRRAYWFLREDWWTTALGQWLCERGGHAPGVVWYASANATEPDMHCRRCWRDLG